MNFFNRAIKNVTRKLSKSVLLALTFFVIGNFVIIGLGVSNAASSAKTLTRQKMRAVVEYNLDYSAYWDWADKLEDEEERNEAYSSIPYLTEDEITNILSDERVKTVNATSTTQMYGEDFEPVPLNNQYEENNSDSTYTSCYIDSDGQEVCEENIYVDPDVMVKANAYPDMIEFADGMYILKEGRFYTADEIASAASVCLITDTMAEYNNLKIGDTIKLYVENPAYIEREGNYYSEMGLTKEDVLLELEIIGIFENTEKLDPSAANYDWMSTYESPENVVLMPDSAYINVQYEIQCKDFEYGRDNYPDYEYYQDEANYPKKEDIMRKGSITILLNDPLEVEGFVEDYSANMPEFRKIDANNETFEQLARPLDTLTLFATFIVWLVIINAIIIITLVTALTLKTREYEIGVLLSQGVSKAKIVMQFFVELAIVAIIGFSVAVVSGSAVAGQVGQKVLEYQVDFSGLTQEEEDDYFYYDAWNTNYFTEVSLEDMVAEYEVTISPVIIGEIYVAGLGIVLVSILIPSLMVMRFNPKRILMSAQ